MKRTKAKIKPAQKLPKGIDSTYELEYLNILNSQKQQGLILDYIIKPCSLRLGNGCHYEPDFMVITSEGFIEFHEIKGNTRFAQKSLTKLKAAAYIFQIFTFRLCWGNPVKGPDGKKKLEFDIKEIE